MPVEKFSNPTSACIKGRIIYINDFSVDVICSIVIYADDTNLYCKCDEASSVWQQLELTSELDSDIRG